MEKDSTTKNCGKQVIILTLIENLSFLRAQKVLKFEFVVEAFIIFIKRI